MTRRFLRATLRRALGLALPFLLFTALVPVASASVIDESTCTPKTGYALRDAIRAGSSVRSGSATLVVPSAGLVALEFGLGQNYPNPVAQSTTVEYTLAEPATARLAVYNMLGQEVLVLAGGHQEAGQYRVHLDASALASGTYVYRLVTPTESATKRLTVVR